MKSTSVTKELKYAKTEETRTPQCTMVGGGFLELQVRNRLQISFLILSKFKWINFYSPWIYQQTYGFYIRVTSYYLLRELRVNFYVRILNKNFNIPSWSAFLLNNCFVIFQLINFPKHFSGQKRVNKKCHKKTFKKLLVKQTVTCNSCIKRNS